MSRVGDSALINCLLKENNMVVITLFLDTQGCDKGMHTGLLMADKRTSNIGNLSWTRLDTTVILFICLSVLLLL